MSNIRHLKKIKFINFSNIMPNIFLLKHMLFFFALNVIKAQELESDLILAKNNISFGKFVEAELILNNILFPAARKKERKT